jgi:hypothetical protein
LLVRTSSKLQLSTGPQPLTSLDVEPVYPPESGNYGRTFHCSLHVNWEDPAVQFQTQLRPPISATFHATKFVQTISPETFWLSRWKAGHTRDFLTERSTVVRHMGWFSWGKKPVEDKKEVVDKPTKKICCACPETKVMLLAPSPVDVRGLIAEGSVDRLPTLLEKCLR